MNVNPNEKATAAKIQQNLSLAFNAKPIIQTQTLHVAFFLRSSKTAAQIYAVAITDLPKSATGNLKDLWVIELGTDYQTNSRESPVAAWMNSHQHSA